MMEAPSALLAPLQRAAFTVAGAPTSWAEVLGFVSGALCVWLVARQNIWNWPIGLLNNAFFFILFFFAKLYADAALQGVFAVLALYGWYEWLRGGPSKEALRVRRTTRTEWGALLLTTVVGTGAVTFYLAHHTDSPVPLPDAAVLVLSLVATYGQAKKLVESWWVWIAVDVISVPLYVNRNLYATALLYVGFLLLCVMGLRRWRASL